ncbi:MAG: PAS domain-containing protein [Actinobacteria bacterium]|uniref:Oxygen sensor histidine kinase NreB n=1 Tax=freshwater metagenome TaxID=449393 RepID=A0A6J6BTR2_9ZZZZ|nr:PAS domain-containing protein [Actinomycetota bacterium]
MELFDLFDDPVLIVDARRRRICGGNAAARRLMDGLELDGAAVTDVFPMPQEHRPLIAAIERASSGALADPVELMLLDEAGRMTLARCSVCALAEAAGAGSVLVHISIDRDADPGIPMVFESRRRAVAVLDALQDGVVEIDLRSDSYVYANPCFTEMTGIPLVDLLALPPPVAGIAGTSMAEVGALVERVGEDGPESARVMMDGCDGPFPALVTAVRVSRPHRRWMVVTFHDLRTEQAAEEELLAAHEELAVANERERIARDLHDNVIQQLFVAGITLQASIGSPDQDTRTLHVVDELDAVMRDIRSTIYALRDRRVLLEGLEVAIRSLVDDVAPALGSPVQLCIDGDLDLVPAAMQADVLSTLRELLSNITRHARAHHASASVSVDRERLVLAVEDDGIGVVADVSPAAAPDTGGLGLDNARRRAARHGGDVDMRPRDGGGTSVLLTLPLRRHDDAELATGHARSSSRNG